MVHGVPVALAIRRVEGKVDRTRTRLEAVFNGLFHEAVENGLMEEAMRPGLLRTFFGLGPITADAAVKKVEWDHRIRLSILRGVLQHHEETLLQLRLLAETAPEATVSFELG